MTEAGRESPAAAETFAPGAMNKGPISVEPQRRREQPRRERLTQRIHLKADAHTHDEPATH